eukprot:jgi/Undpi1/3123/HiC_scaffold_15.g06497.m1
MTTTSSFMIAVVMGSPAGNRVLRAGLATLTLACGACAFSTPFTAFSPVPGSAGGLTARGSGSCAVPARQASTCDVFKSGHVLTLDGTANGRWLRQQHQLRSASAAIPSEASSNGGGGDVAADAGEGAPAKTRIEKFKAYPSAFYKFTRPHTIRGTILASITGVARALAENPTAISMDLVPSAMLGLVALLLGNAFIVGINQIYDVKIDKINKPELPVASGEISTRLAWGLVLGSLATGPTIVYNTFSPLIFRLYSFGLLIGGLYSVPPFTFKRFPVMAGLTIACVRGFLLNFGVYYAVREALGLSFKWNPAVLFLARFMTVFAGIIAVTKDLPDVKGDKKYNISTFASKRGVKFTARAACAVLALNYVSAIVQGVLSPAGTFNKRVMVGGHSLLLVGLGATLRKLVPDSQESVKGFYKRIWDLFYLEYAMYPFI